MGKFEKKAMNSRRSGGQAPAPGDHMDDSLTESKPDASPKQATQKPASPKANSQALLENPELPKISLWLSKVKFRRKIIGGVDPLDMWKKIEILNSLYERALIAERVRYDMLLQQQKGDAEPHGEADTHG